MASGFPRFSEEKMKEIWEDLLSVLENKFGKESISEYFDSCDTTFTAIDPETRKMIKVKGGRGWMENAIKTIIRSGDGMDRQAKMDARIQLVQICYKSAISVAVKKLKRLEWDNLASPIEKIEGFIDKNFPLELNKVLGVGLVEMAIGRMGDGLVEIAFGRIEPEKCILLHALMTIELMVIEPEAELWRDAWREIT